MGYKQTPEHKANFLKAIHKRMASGPIDKSRCGLPRNKPEDVWKKIDKRGPDECWLWTAGHDLKGYGMFRIEGRYYRSHRVVYGIVNEPIDFRSSKDAYANDRILHHCDNPPCCNPKHLYRGDIFDNARDKVSRGRQSRKRTTAAFTMDQAASIRIELKANSIKSIAQKYGVAYSVIKDIRRGRTYNVSS